MATITRIEGKKKNSFKITVTLGRDKDGKQIRRYKTYTPPAPMSPKKAEKEAERIAIEFEKQLREGFEPDNNLTFSEYADSVLKAKKRTGKKDQTIDGYEDLLERKNKEIGFIKLRDLRPYHLNNFYEKLSERGERKDAGKATAKPKLREVVKSAGLSHAKVAALASVSEATVDAACNGKRIRLSSAEKISKALEKRTKDLFEITNDLTPLSNKTVLEHHRLIHTILAQAEKEMIVPYNAASKASPPSSRRKDPTFFQPEELRKIVEALASEPIKWRTMTMLLMATGARRGEVTGLKWQNVDFENCCLKIEVNNQYSRKKGLYEGTVKTESSFRVLNVGPEIMALLREYREWYDEQRTLTGDLWVDTGFLFVQVDGRQMNPSSVTAWLNKFSERHGLPHIYPHAFRHTAASLLVYNGTNIVTVSKWLGHSRPSTTEDIYAHMIAEANAIAGACISDAIFGRKK